MTEELDIIYLVIFMSSWVKKNLNRWWIDLSSNLAFSYRYGLNSLSGSKGEDSGPELHD